MGVGSEVWSDQGCEANGDEVANARHVGLPVGAIEGNTNKRASIAVSRGLAREVAFACRWSLQALEDFSFRYRVSIRYVMYLGRQAAPWTGEQTLRQIRH